MEVIAHRRPDCCKSNYLKFRRLLSVCFLLLLFTFSGCSMALGKTFVLCSQFNGRLVDASGSPVTGVVVRRTWEWAWNGEKGSEETVTDAEGRFSFPEVTGSSFLAGILPHEASIYQEVKAERSEGTVLLYAVNKATYDRNSELMFRDLKGPGINLLCRIDKEPSSDGPFRGTCIEDGL